LQIERRYFEYNPFVGADSVLIFHRCLIECLLNSSS